MGGWTRSWIGLVRFADGAGELGWPAEELARAAAAWFGVEVRVLPPQPVPNTKRQRRKAPSGQPPQPTGRNWN